MLSIFYGISQLDFNIFGVQMQIVTCWHYILNKYTKILQWYCAIVNMFLSFLCSVICGF